MTPNYSIVGFQLFMATIQSYAISQLELVLNIMV
jgi:hypothetical protein